MPKHRALPPLAELQEFFDYDPLTGLLVWKKSLNARAPVGAQAGTIDAYGYLIVGFKGHTYKVHRIAYYLGSCIDPKDLTIDHINRDKSDNRLANLRLATRLQQMMNREAKGYTWSKSRNKWQAGIRVNGKLKYLGRFNTKEEAAAAYEKAATLYFKQFAPIK